MKAPRRFAEGTSVPVPKSRMEIETLLAKHRADQILMGTDRVQSRGFVGFTLQGRQYRLMVPPRDGKARNQEQIERERWRALLLLLKAKLEVVASGMVSIDEEFLAYMVLPNGKTVGAEIAPRLAEAYESGEMPNLLPA